MRKKPMSCQIKDMFIACQPPYHWRCFGNGYYYTLFRGCGLVIILMFCHTWSAFEDIVQTLLMHWRKILKCVFVCFSALVTSDNASRTIYLLCKLIIRLKIICKLKNPSATNYCYMSYNKAESISTTHHSRNSLIYHRAKNIRTIFQIPFLTCICLSCIFVFSVAFLFYFNIESRQFKIFVKIKVTHVFFGGGQCEVNPGWQYQLFISRMVAI